MKWLNTKHSEQDAFELDISSDLWSSKSQTLQRADSPFRASWGGEVEMYMKQMSFPTATSSTKCSKLYTRRFNFSTCSASGSTPGAWTASAATCRLHCPEHRQSGQCSCRENIIFSNSICSCTLWSHCSEIVTTTEGQVWRLIGSSLWYSLTSPLLQDSVRKT